MAAARFFQHFQLNAPQGFAASNSLLQILVVADHQIARDLIANRPEAHYDGLGPGDSKRTPEPVHAFSIADLTESRVACREHDQFGSPEIQSAGFKSRQ